MADEVETLFSLSAVRVEGHTRVYEDAALRAAVRAAADLDHIWRFFFATQVSFSPPLASGIAPLVRSRVESEARSSFADDLLARGFENVAAGDSRRARVRSGARAEFTPFEARYRLPAPDERALDIEGVLAVWLDDGFVVAGGAYPANLAAVLGDELDVGADASGYREELLDLVRSVGR